VSNLTGTPTLGLRIAELEDRCHDAAIECAELRAAAAGTERFERLASLARVLEQIEDDLGRLRAAGPALAGHRSFRLGVRQPPQHDQREDGDAGQQ
jgi:hypothetical protein